MKFGKTLSQSILKEWRFYSVDYKTLKTILKKSNGDQLDLVEDSDRIEEFHRVLEESKHKLTKFYQDRESWAHDYFGTLEKRVEDLRNSAESSLSAPEGVATPISTSSLSSRSSLNNLSESDDESDESQNKNSMRRTKSVVKFDHFLRHCRKQSSGNLSFLKEECRRVGETKHFQHFIYAKKSLATFDRELDLLLEFLSLNRTAFSKILKKYDKSTGCSIRDSTMEEINASMPFLDGVVLKRLQERVEDLIDEVNTLKPCLPEGWGNRKVYTIGCFDLFHRGHQNVLLSLREFGYFVVAGIHDDHSYFQLKNKKTIDNLETRIKNVKPFVDQVFVIPSTDPLLYIQGVVSEQDIETGSCCYARGDDMLDFPGREWIESVMPVHFVPRTESCSSTLIRTIYHAEDETLRAKAAFAKTRYDGKPVDEYGNVLKFNSN